MNYSLKQFYAEGHYAESHYAECRYAECRYAECHYTECRYAEWHIIICSIWYTNIIKLVPVNVSVIFYVYNVPDRLVAQW